MSLPDNLCLQSLIDNVVRQLDKALVLICTEPNDNQAELNLRADAAYLIDKARSSLRSWAV